MDDWFAKVVGEDFDIVPRDLLPEPRSKGFHEGFFGGKAAGEVGDGVLEPVAVVLLPLGKEAVDEVHPVPFDALAHPVNFNDIVS